MVEIGAARNKWNTDRGELSKDYDDEDAKMPEKVWKEVRVK
jgi:hypothetical protein